MNTKIKKDINTIGLIGYIITIVLIVAVICAMVANALGIAAAASVSGENVDVKVDTNISVTSASNILSKLDTFIGVDGIDDLEDVKEGSTVDVDDDDLSSLSLQKVDDAYVLNIQQNPVTFTAGRFIVALCVTFVYLASIVVMLYMLKSLMKAFRNCDTPFSLDIVKKMERFAYSLIPYAVLSMLTESFWGDFMLSGRFDFSFSLSKVFVIVFVFILCMIFKYGAQLQQESDETL